LQWKSRPPTDEVISKPNAMWSMLTRGMRPLATSHWACAVMSTHELVVWWRARKL
jgi:hypothetical protein